MEIEQVYRVGDHIFATEIEARKWLPELRQKALRGDVRKILADMNWRCLADSAPDEAAQATLDKGVEALFAQFDITRKEAVAAPIRRGA